MPRLLLLTSLLITSASALAGSLPMSQAVSPLPGARLAEGGNPDSFCGACTAHDDCGTSEWRCCANGCSSEQKQCWKVASCDEIAAAKTPAQLADSRP